MAGDFLGRMANLIKGAASSLIKDLERDNPDAVLQAAIESQQDRYKHAHAWASQLERRCVDLSTQREVARREAQSLGEQAADLAGSDEQKALELLEKKQARLARSDDIDRELAETRSKLEAARTEQRRAQEDLERLKSEKEQLSLEFQSSRTREARDGMVSGVPGNAADSALENLRERMDRIENGGEDRAAAREQGRRRAEAELEALRKSASPSPSPRHEIVEATVDGLPARTLETPETTEASETPDEGDPQPELPKRTL